MMIKRITIISSYFAPAWSYGGPPKVLFTIASTLVRMGIKVRVITTDSLGEARSNIPFEIIDGIEIYRFKNLSNTLAYKTNFFYTWQDFSIFKRILRDTDKVLFSDTRSIFNWQMLKFVKSANISYGVFAFGQIPYGIGIKSVVKRIFDFLWVKSFIRDAKYLFAQTEHEKQMYSIYFKVPKKNVVLLQLPIKNTGKAINQQRIVEFRKKWRIKAHDKVIIFVGRINYLKGVDILVKSVGDLLKKNRNIKLLIIGRDDGFLSSLKKLVTQDFKNKIIFTGALYGDDLKNAFAVSSCFAITPRFFEETSTASLEAMSAGLPVVVTKEAEIPYLSDYNAGLIVENQPSKISEAIERVLFTTSLEKERMQSDAKKCIEEHFLAEKVVPRLVEVISA